MILVINVDHSNAHVLKPTKFDKEDIWERKHIEEWNRKHPEIVRERLLVVSIELDWFDQIGDRSMIVEHNNALLAGTSVPNTNLLDRVGRSSIIVHKHQYMQLAKATVGYFTI